MNLDWQCWSRAIWRAENDLAEDLSNLDLIFRDLPIEIFGHLLLEVPDRYPRLKRLLPSMPSDQVQRNWAGDCGPSLLYKGTEFVKSALKYIPYDHIRSDNLRALDFGCGWGRLLRLFSKYFPIANLEGVDPWEDSISACRESGIRHPVHLSEYLPQMLPTLNQSFQFIYAFSVFTHLSQLAFKTCLETLHRYLSLDGVLLMTIRPAEYWLQVNQPEAYEQHSANGWAYIPHPFKMINGDSVYGDTSISLERLSECPGWNIVDVEVSRLDPLQIFVTMRKRI